jgi:predicted MFS family arabinose efflux permease
VCSSDLYGANPEQISLTFAYFGSLALIGNLALNRVIDKFNPAWFVSLTLALIALSMLAWPLAGSMAVLLLVLLPWSLSGFATNSAQQARLGGLSPSLAPALLALNTSAIYTGHALGAGSGSWAIDHAGGYETLHWLGLVWVLCALALSVWAHRAGRVDARLKPQH